MLCLYLRLLVSQLLFHYYIIVCGYVNICACNLYLKFSFIILSQFVVRKFGYKVPTLYMPYCLAQHSISSRCTQSEQAQNIKETSYNLNICKLKAFYPYFWFSTIKHYIHKNQVKKDSSSVFLLTKKELDETNSRNTRQEITPLQRR